MEQRRQLVLLVEPGDRTWRVVEIIPQEGLVAIGIEDDRTLAVHRLQAVGVELRLLLPDFRIDGGLLRLDHRQRLPVVSPEDVVGITDARLGRHARHFVFTVLFSVQSPTGAFQSEIDDEFPGLVLVPVVGLGDALVLRLDGREAFTQRFQFAFDLLTGLRRRIPLGLQGLQLLDAGWGGCRSHFRDERFVEGLALQALRALTQVGAARPVEDVIELPHDIQCLLRCWRLVGVGRHVARLSDVFGLLPNDLGHEFAEGRVADVTVQVRDLRGLQSLLDPVDTLEQALQCVPGMEAGRPRVSDDMPLRKARTLRHVREFLFQKSEVFGEFHSGSEVSPKGAGLQGGEEGVELGEVGAVAVPLVFDGFNDDGEATLEIKRGNKDRHSVQNDHC